MIKYHFKNCFTIMGIKSFWFSTFLRLNKEKAKRSGFRRSEPKYKRAPSSEILRLEGL